MPTYIASRLSESNVLFPDKIEIEHQNVIYYKGAIIGYQTMVIPRSNIASVRIRKGLLFADVIIESKGGGVIIAKGFTKSDAMDIMGRLV